MPLTDAGYTALRAADYLQTIQDRFDALTGQQNDYSADTVLGMLTNIMADLLGEESEAIQAIYDAFDPNNATGVQLDNLCLLVGVQRDPATYGTVTLTCTGTVGTFIPAYTKVQGGGTDGTQRWSTSEDATIGGGGTVDVVATCDDAGAIEADADSITTIVTPVSGFISVTNASAADAGQDRESDAALRLRRVLSLQQAGSTSLNAMRAAILAIDTVTAAVVLENTTQTDLVVAGLTLVPHSVAVIVAPDSMTTATKELVGRAIYDTIAAGIDTNGSDVTIEITGLDGFVHDITFDFATDLTVNVETTVTLKSGYVLADVETSVEDAVSAYFATLTVGSPVYRLQMLALIAAIEGVASAEIELNGVASDVTPTLVEFPVLGTNTVTT